MLKKSSASPEDQVQGSGADGLPEQFPVPEHFQRVQCAAGGAGHSAKLPAHQRSQAKPIQITPETGADLSLNDKGEVDLDEGYVIGKAADVFGEKIYESTPALDTALQTLTNAPAKGSIWNP